MIISTEELKSDTEKSHLLYESQDISIARNGKSVAKLSGVFQDNVAAVESLVGLLPENVSLDESKEERLSRI